MEAEINRLGHAVIGGVEGAHIAIAHSLASRRPTTARTSRIASEIAVIAVILSHQPKAR
jgi:hypothetical protein